MIIDKIRHIAILEEQLERLQQSANVISGISGQDLDTVEYAIVSLLSRCAGDEAICSLNYHLMLAEKGDTVCGVCRTSLRA